MALHGTGLAKNLPTLGCRFGDRVTVLHGRAVQVGPIKPTLEAPGTERLKLALHCGKLLSNSAFNFNLRRYSTAGRPERRP